MATINRYRVNWSGFTGAPGVSTFYTTDAATSALADIREFFNDLKDIIPPSVTLSFPNSGDQLDSTTGGLVGGWTQTAAASVTGSAPVGFFAGGVGARVVWETGNIVDGRRVRGSTFIVPLSTSAYATDGSLIADAITILTVAANGLESAGVLEVWSRPSGGSSAISAVTAATIPDAISTLRTRRT